MRIVPHDQNTGAFFIAVLHKVSHLPAIQEKSASSQKKLSTRNGLHENLSDQATEEINGLEVSSVDGTDEKILEVASEVDKNISKIASEADERISEVTSDDEKISEVALEADLVDEPDEGSPESNSTEATQGAVDKKIDSAKTGREEKVADAGQVERS
ncbi:hypothetical protein V6N13_076697 [Hibiscus sabdariffa]